MLYFVKLTTVCQLFTKKCDFSFALTIFGNFLDHSLAISQVEVDFRQFNAFKNNSIFCSKTLPVKKPVP